MDNEIAQIANSIWADNNTFTILCAVQPIALTLISLLVRQGFRHDPAASLVILLDVPRGFALRSLETSNTTTHQFVVVTWSFCPEYWEDLWDQRPNILLVGDGLNLDLAIVMAWARQGSRYRLTPGKSTTLSPTERRILHLVASGHTNEAIATQLSLHLQTVKNTLTTIYHKLGLHNRSEALMYYWDIWRGDTDSSTSEDE